LIAELDAGFLKWYSPDHMFGLHPNEERDPRLHFFVIYQGENAVGCGALRVLDENTGELKRMYVREAYRRRGISRKLIHHLENTARELGISCMRLETGPEQVEALALYESCGYSYIPPYGEYVGSPVSICMEKALG
jgi:GNAT superfamily N-acetyltransferase